MDVTCPKCGAENYDAARYCRKCGEQIGSSDFYEAPTRELGRDRAPAPPDPRRYETFPSAPLNQGASAAAPRYVPPPVHPVPFAGAGATGMPARVNTAPMTTGPVAKKRNWLLIIGGVIMAFFLGIGVLVAIVANIIEEENRDRQKQGQKAGQDTPPPGRSGIRVLENPKVEQLPAEVQPWFYEGATGREFVSGGLGFGNIAGSVLTMETEDDAATVAEYYRTKLGGEGSDITEDGDEFVLSNNNGTVVTIEAHGGEEGNTEIVVLMGGPGGGAHPVIPPIPPVTGGPAVPETPKAGTPPAPPPAPPAAPAAPATPSSKK